MPTERDLLHQAAMDRIEAARTEIRDCEVMLRGAIVRSDIQMLDRLLSDDLVFTNQDGQTLSKADDLDAHRSSLLKIDKLDAVDEQIRVTGACAIVTVQQVLAGRYSGQPFEGRFAYTRFWCRKGGQWRVEAAHCSSVTSA